MPANRWGSEILKSFFGRRHGMDHFDFLAGPAGLREPQESIAVASTLDTFGTSVLTGSTAIHTIQAPLKPGQLKEIVNASSVSTATMSLVRSTANGACSFASQSTQYGALAADAEPAKRLNLLFTGTALTLRAISTAQWAVVNRPSTTFLTMSTSS